MPSTLTTSLSSRQIVFIDSNVSDAKTLLAGIDPGYQIAYLNAASSALDQMAAALSGQNGIEAIHLLSHGSSGTLALSGGTITTASLSETDNASALETIRASLTDTADFLLYGCNVADGSDGLAFINALADATGADVAASTDLTGAATKGGDWALEAQTGQIEAQTVQNESYQETLAATPRTYTVTAHTSANNISNVTVIFTDAQFTGGSAAQVTGSANRTLSIQFNDPSLTPPVSVSVLKGFWAGTQGTSSTQAIILANGDTWMVFMDAGVATRFARLQTTASGSSFSSTGNQYKLLTGTTEAATASGTFGEKTTISGTMFATSGTSSLNLVYDIRYDTTASLNDAIGSWRGSYGGGTSSLIMTIAATGVLNGSSTTGCSYSGSLQPRSADPAVFDVRFTETCLATVAKNLEGITTINAAKTGISFAVTTADKTQGALFNGIR